MRISRPFKTDSSETLFSKIPIFFLCLAVLSTLGLDYIQWKRGQKAYIFSILEGKKEVIAHADKAKEAGKAEQEEADMPQTLLNTAADSGIPDDSINLFTDEEGVYHLLVDMPLKKYSQVESSFFDTFRAFGFQITDKEEQQTDEKKYYLWQAQDRKNRKITLLFSCDKEGIKIARRPVALPGAGKIALIVDDMGYSLGAINELCSIDRPLTIAIIPYSPLASEIATISKQHDLEVILHLPLEAIDENNNGSYSKGMITAEMNKSEIIATLDKNLNQVPYISGVNNHMGSKITSDSQIMNIILEHLKDRGLFFIDSRTTGNSVAYDIAQSLNIPSAYRNIFLDGELDEDYIRQQLFELFRRAQKNGFALGICHPNEETLKVLKESFHLADEYGLEPVLASQIVKTP